MPAAQHFNKMDEYTVNYELCFWNLQYFYPPKTIIWVQLFEFALNKMNKFIGTKINIWKKLWILKGDVWGTIHIRIISKPLETYKIETVIKATWLWLTLEPRKLILAKYFDKNCSASGAAAPACYSILTLTALFWCN